MGYRLPVISARAFCTLIDRLSDQFHDGGCIFIGSSGVAKGVDIDSWGRNTPHLAQFLSVYLTVKVFSPVITVSYCRVIRLSVNLGRISPPDFWNS